MSAGSQLGSGARPAARPTRLWGPAAPRRGGGQLSLRLQGAWRGRRGPSPALPTARRLPGGRRGRAASAPAPPPRRQRAAQRRRAAPLRSAPGRRVATMAVLLETTLGDLVIDLYTEERPRGRSAAGGAGGGGRGFAPCAGRWRPRVKKGGGGRPGRRQLGREVGVVTRPALLPAAAVARTRGWLPCRSRRGSRGCGGWDASPGFPSLRGRGEGPPLPAQAPGSPRRCPAPAAPLVASRALCWGCRNGRCVRCRGGRLRERAPSGRLQSAARLLPPGSRPCGSCCGGRSTREHRLLLGSLGFVLSASVTAGVWKETGEEKKSVRFPVAGCVQGSLNR